MKTKFNLHGERSEVLFIMEEYSLTNDTSHPAESPNKSCDVHVHNEDIEDFSLDCNDHNVAFRKL